MSGQQDAQQANTPRPTIGRMVHYGLSEQDVMEINRLRDDTRVRVAAGDVYPATIVRVFDPSSTTVNLQVALDGTDTLWATSRPQGDEPGQWFWPPRV